MKRKNIKTKRTDTTKVNRKKAVDGVDPSRFTSHVSHSLVTFFNHVLHSSITFFITFFMLAVSAEATTSTIVNTKHNLSVTGPGDIRSTSETRICVFCHTPHNAAPKTPLWNKNITGVTYILYQSTTLAATGKIRQPDGPTRLCLSCHDGTVALGAVLKPSENISMTYQYIPQSRPTYIGTFLQDDHPVSFSYYASLSNPEINPAIPSTLLFYNNGSVDCSTCHDPHEDAYQSLDKNGVLTGKFLAVNNISSALCTMCHIKNGWSTCTHRTSTSPINGVLPVTPRTWPTWPAVNQWGCEECHATHGAGGYQRLLYYASEEANCYTCHNGSVAQKNIYSEFQKFSHHQVEYATGVHDPTESPKNITNHVECVDCHEPHASNSNTASAPNISGRLNQVSGVDINGSSILPPNYALYEYQICFKCHADTVPIIPFSAGFPRPRVINSTNAVQQFSTLNASYHPVAGIGKNTSFVPSIANSQYVAGIMTSSSIIYCMDCHESDDSSGIPGAGYAGPRGPHGSQYPPMIREEYLTADNTPESYANYALCYRCHDRTTVLNQVGSSGSWTKHYDHIVTDNTPCSACHDPHGIYDTAPGTTGSHSRLINFDTSIVLPVSPNTVPLFNSSMPGSGNCTLLCHGHPHNHSIYP